MFCRLRHPLLRQLALFSVSSVTSTQEEQSTLTQRSCLRSRKQPKDVPAWVVVAPLAWVVYITCLKLREVKESSSPWQVSFLHRLAAKRPESICGAFQEPSLCRLLHVRNVFTRQQSGSSRAHDASTRCRTAHLGSLFQGLL